MSDDQKYFECDECGDFVTMIWSLGSRERCFHCHIDSPSWDVDPAYAGENYWSEDE